MPLYLSYCRHKSLKRLAAEDLQFLFFLYNKVSFTFTVAHMFKLFMSYHAVSIGLNMFISSEDTHVFFYKFSL